MEKNNLVTKRVGLDSFKPVKQDIKWLSPSIHWSGCICHVCSENLPHQKHIPGFLVLLFPELSNSLGQRYCYLWWVKRLWEWSLWHLSPLTSPWWIRCPFDSSYQLGLLLKATPKLLLWSIELMPRAKCCEYAKSEMLHSNLRGVTSRWWLCFLKGEYFWKLVILERFCHVS